MSVRNILMAAAGASTAAPPGQVAYTTPGTYAWTVPAGVTSVCVVCVGGGGRAGWCGAGGGGLAWRNNISVTPGQSVSIQVGRQGTNDGVSFFGGATSSGVNVVAAPGQEYPYASGGGFYGQGGGNGGGVGSGSATYAGGGGAGGYSGNGGNGNGNPYGGLYSGSTGSAGSGGGGGGGGLYYCGGGVSIYGQGANGSHVIDTYGQGYGGGGSGGETGTNTYAGNYGGGAGGKPGEPSGLGSSGAVRIIWGAGRSFPSTNTGDV